MAILTKIGGIPLFTSVGEALAWAKANFMQGYHTHTYRGKVGYMGGKTHSRAINQRYNNINQTTTSQIVVPQNPIPPPPPIPTPVVTPPTPVVQPTPPPTPQPIQINYGSGGGGGGY
jgi:hypothetical protein